MKIWKVELELESETNTNRLDILDYLEFKINVGEGIYADIDNKCKVKLIKRIKDDE